MTTTKKLISLGLDTSILLLFVGLVAINWPSKIWYQLGITNYAMVEGLPFGELLPFLLICLLPLGCIAVMILRLILRRKLVPAWGSVVRCSIVLLMCAGIVWALGFRDPGGTDKFAQGFEEKMKHEANVKAIRAWANDLVVPAEEGSMPSVPENLWPKCVTVLSPRSVLYDADVMGVKLYWGGGFREAYGLVVGPENMETPSSTEMELIIPLEAGAYLFFYLG